MYLKSDTLLFTDVFEYFRKMGLNIYHLHPVKFHLAPGLAWQTSLKKAEVKLEFLTDSDILLMVEKSIIGAIYHAIHQYAKANDKHMTDYVKIKNHHILNAGI